MNTEHYLGFFVCFLLLISSAFALSTTNLKAYYKFEDTNTILLTDYFGYDNNGLGAVGIVRDSNGKNGASYYYNGGGGVESTLTTTGFPTDKMSVSLWSKSTTGGVNDGIFSTGTYNSDNLEIYKQTAGAPNSVVGIFATTSDAGIVGDTALDNNNWYHLVATYDGVSGRFWVNGVYKGKRDVAFVIDLAGMVFADTPSSGENFNGWIDEASIWDANLTDANIAELYNSGLGLTYCEPRTDYFADSNFSTVCTYTLSDGIMRWTFYDENTGSALTGVSIDYNGTPQTVTGSTYDVNLLEFPSTSTNYIFTISKTGYGTRYYQTDLNSSIGTTINFQLLPTDKGQNVSFRFFAPDQTTIISNQYIEALDYNNTVYGYSIGKLKTNSTGDINFFLNLNDANIHFLINNGEYDYNTVILTVKRPKDEETGLDINAAWTVTLSGLGSQSYLNTSDANKIFALYSNTVDTYRLQVDSNSTSPTYSSRTFLLNYYGNPLTDTIQPYLLNTSDAVLTKLVTLQQDIIGVNTLPGIVIKIYKNIPGYGLQIIQQTQTDGKGQSSATLMSGDSYIFNLYQNGAILAFNQQTSIPINVITTTITFTIDSTITTPFIPGSKGVFVEWEPLNNSIEKKSTGTLDINQYLYNAQGSSNIYSAELHAYIDGNELLIGGVLPYFVGSTAANTIIYNNIPWNQLPLGEIVFILDINQLDGNTYAYSQTYYLFGTDENIAGTTYTFDILQGLRVGIKEDLGYEENDLCPPLIALALLITFGSIGILTLKVGSFGGQGTVGMALALLALFTFINWIPIELTAIAFIVGGAFIINDANLR